MDFRAECENRGIRDHGEMVWRKMVEQVKKICEEYNLALSAEELLSFGMDELFFEDGTLDEDYLKQEIEKGKMWAFGDGKKEATWASHIGD